MKNSPGREQTRSARRRKAACPESKRCPRRRQLFPTQAANTACAEEESAPGKQHKTPARKEQHECRTVTKTKRCAKAEKQLTACIGFGTSFIYGLIEARLSASRHTSSGQGQGLPVLLNVGRWASTLRRYCPSSLDRRRTMSGCSAATSCFSPMSSGMLNNSFLPVS